jgi:hypothetical protein
MSREKEDYRLNMERLIERFGYKEVLSLKEACDYLKCDRRTIINTKKFPVKQVGNKYIIPLTGFARWLSA